MTSEYERQLGRARLARRQADETTSIVPAASENRIDDLLRRRGEDTVRPSAVLHQEPSRTESQAVSKTAVKPSSYRRILVRIFYIIGVFVILPVMILGAYRVFVNFEAPKDTASDVVKAVGKLVNLPQGEEPTVATITDLAPLAGHEFFKDARIGDKVIIYKESGKAILYRPSKNKVIAVAPLDK